MSSGECEWELTVCTLCYRCAQKQVTDASGHAWQLHVNLHIDNPTAHAMAVELNVATSTSATAAYNCCCMMHLVRRSHTLCLQLVMEALHTPLVGADVKAAPAA